MKIVSLSPSLTEILKAIGAGPEIAGATENCSFVGKAARIGKPNTLQSDRILSLQPDLILSDGENRPEEIRALKEKHRVLSFETHSVEDAVRNILLLGEAAGHLAEAEKLAGEIVLEREENRRLWAARKRVPSLVFVWNQPFMTASAGSYIGSLLEASGGINVFDEESMPQFPIDFDDIAEKGMKLLLLPSEPYPFSPKDIQLFRKYPLFADVSIEVVDGRFFSQYGPATVEALRYLNKLFLKLNPVNEMSSSS